MKTEQKQYIALEEWQQIYDWIDKGLVTREELIRMLIRKWGVKEGKRIVESLIFGRE